MKNYVSPVILENDELAEGIFAAGSGEVDYDNDPNCWTVKVDLAQVVAHEGYANFRIQANHPNNLVHISSQSSVVITFSQPITSAVFEGFDVEVAGCVVTTTRVSHGNSYNSADQYNSLLKVYCADPASLTIVGKPMIFCKHETNVQGGFD